MFEIFKEISKKYNGPEDIFNTDTQNVSNLVQEKNRKVFENRSRKEQTHSLIPCFYKPSKKICSSAQNDLFIEFTRDTLNWLREDMLLEQDELDFIWDYLESSSLDGQIDYGSFSKIKSTLQNHIPIEKLEYYFRPSIFLKFYRDNCGRVNINYYFNYVLRMCTVLQTSIKLHSLNRRKDNFITVDELQQYIVDLIPEMPAVSHKIENDESHDIYVRTAVERILFHQDPLCREKVNIDIMVTSTCLFEMHELRYEEINMEDLVDNCYSYESILSVHKTFQSLDFSDTNYLSINEMLSFNKYSLTKTFVRNLFQVHTEHGRRMVYKEFVRFLLVFENPQAPTSLRYIFQILDTDGTGLLTREDIVRYAGEVVTKYMTYPIEEKKDENPHPKVHWVVSEIFDMTGAKTSGVTLRDIMRLPENGIKALRYMYDVDILLLEKIDDDEIEMMREEKMKKKAQMFL